MKKKPKKQNLIEQRLFESERLFQQFVELTPYKFKPFGKSFSTWEEYERWKHAQKNPWYK